MVAYVVPVQTVGRTMEPRAAKVLCCSLFFFFQRSQFKMKFHVRQFCCKLWFFNRNPFLCIILRWHQDFYLVYFSFRIACVIAHSDVDECETNNGGCDSKRKCNNTPGGHICGSCPNGWKNNGDTGCKGLCLLAYISKTWWIHLYCENCGCKQTHTPTTVCSDVNECEKNNGGCHGKRKCTNTLGGRTCGPCPVGWTNDGDKECKGMFLIWWFV